MDAVRVARRQRLFDNRNLIRDSPRQTAISHTAVWVICGALGRAARGRPSAGPANG